MIYRAQQALDGLLWADGRARARRNETALSRVAGVLGRAKLTVRLHGLFTAPSRLSKPIDSRAERPLQASLHHTSHAGDKVGHFLRCMAAP